MKQDCMTVTLSHHQRQHVELPKKNEFHSSNLGVGVRVMLEGLGHLPVQHKDESWTNPSLLNGSTGVIIRRDHGLWLVALESSNLVSRSRSDITQSTHT